ncbi:hypothetical protein CEXT_21061 [Caerostris extrusa]|uniref:Uncharacterized protein n=1 Tax=Caerostris extrusa TaxID=172846 RepID=A0AAV4YCJ1_CAEEX|nr:hypothetical protein CEXT_21061 [Caerostris extrusa]
MKGRKEGGGREGRKEGMKEGEMDGGKEGRNEGKIEEGGEGKKEGWMDGWMDGWNIAITKFHDTQSHEGSTDGVKGVFPVLPFTAAMRDEYCYKTYKVLPRRDYLDVQ